MSDPERFLSTYETALASQEWEKVDPLIHEDCVVTFNDGTYMGKTAVEGAFRRTFDLIEDEKFNISNVHWVLQKEETAVYIFNFSWSGIIQGKIASGGGRGTSVLIREKGNWQLLCEHLGPLAKSTV